MTLPNTIVRQWLETQRTALVQRLDLLDSLIRELGSLATPPATPPVKPLSPSHRKTLDTLRQAGSEGLTAADLATLDSIPKGTASSRLSIIKSAGLADLNGQTHRYFALHSQTEDNNLSHE